MQAASASLRVSLRHRCFFPCGAFTRQAPRNGSQDWSAKKHVLAFSSTSKVKKTYSSSKLPFPLPVEEKAIMGAWRALAISFSYCLSKKSLSQEPPPQEAQERPFLDDSGRQRCPLASAFHRQRQGKDKLPTAFASSRWPFPSTCPGKYNFRAPPA